eukprot:2076023-Amphidinium_carterae.1
MGGGMFPPPSFTNPGHQPLDQWLELRMAIAGHQNARVQPHVACKAAAVWVLKPHAVDDMPAGVCRDHRTDVPFCNIRHVVLHYATHKALKGVYEGCGTLFTPMVIHQMGQVVSGGGRAGAPDGSLAGAAAGRGR